MDKYSMLKEFIRDILLEELSDEEINALDPESVLIDPDLNMKTVEKVYRDDEDKVSAVDLESYDTADSEGDITDRYKEKVDREDLKDYEVA